MRDWPPPTGPRRPCLLSGPLAQLVREMVSDPQRPSHCVISPLSGGWYWTASTRRTRGGAASFPGRTRHVLASGIVSTHHSANLPVTIKSDGMPQSCGSTRDGGTWFWPGPGLNCGARLVGALITDAIASTPDLVSPTLSPRLPCPRPPEAPSQLWQTAQVRA